MPKVQGRESSLNTISDLDLDELEVGLDHVSRCSLLWKHLLNWKAENVAIEPESKKSVMGSTTEPRDDLEGKKLEDEVIGTNLVAFLGPNIWGDDGIKLELDVELSALLGMEDESVEGHQAAASANAETDTETSYPTDPSVDPVVLKDDCPNTFALDAATEETCKPRRLRRNVNRKRKADQTLTPPGSACLPGYDFDPSKVSFPPEELKPTPMLKKSRKKTVPDTQKDDKYWSRREKNNLAAKRSRDARRLKENQVTLRALYLEEENSKLKSELEVLRAENDSLKSRLQELSACNVKI